MPRKPGKQKKRCRHGLTPLYVKGCPHCAVLALGGLHLLSDNGFTEAAELLFILRKFFKSKDELAAALAEARKEIEEIRAFQKDGTYSEASGSTEPTPQC